ncbi:hypothetical protein KIH79_10545 [Bifidobacterium sp. 82T10]|uniref:CTP synthase n=1 Tax=Bifidobacterium miconis TaxID=2834435 RepID=A0ABS6WH54_9BIFI|nr:hypothetical protein [Bifidobacterium miconis]MBW3093350.1 hypothetical protein [Bifidobacterium miconis]
MTRNEAIDTLIRNAQTERRCAFGVTNAEQRALSRRAAKGTLHRVLPNMYADARYWDTLAPPDKALHTARALNLKHRQWVFGGITAAAAHGFEHQWYLHHDTITVVIDDRGSNTDNPRVKRIHGSREHTVMAGGIPVTDKARTVADCAMMFGLRHALPIVDSALRNGMTAHDILSVCTDLHRSQAPVLTALHHANPASENGGESLARGTMIEHHLMIPELQVAFIDPETGRSYRADFAWRLPGGRIVVGEFDGSQKYVDPSMTRGHGIPDVIQTERERQDGLRRGGATGIVRFTHREVIKRYPFINKLLAAGIPIIGGQSYQT